MKPHLQSPLDLVFKSQILWAVQRHKFPPKSHHPKAYETNCMTGTIEGLCVLGQCRQTDLCQNVSPACSTDHGISSMPFDSFLHCCLQGVRHHDARVCRHALWGGKATFLFASPHFQSFFFNAFSFLLHTEWLPYRRLSAPLFPVLIYSCCNSKPFWYLCSHLCVAW